MSMTGPLTFAGIMIVSVLLLAPGLDSNAPAPVPTIAPTAPAPAAVQTTVGNGFASREMVRQADGHFYADALVNGAQVHFLVDTGATFVALTAADAQRAGIAPSTNRATAMGAGGAVEVRPVTIDRVALGPLAANQISGVVVEDLPISLLGQSFLAQIGSVHIEGDRMILR